MLIHLLRMFVLHTQKPLTLVLSYAMNADSPMYDQGMSEVNEENIRLNKRNLKVVLL